MVNRIQVVCFIQRMNSIQNFTEFCCFSNGKRTNPKVYKHELGTREALRAGYLLFVICYLLIVIRELRVEGGAARKALGAKRRE